MLLTREADYAVMCILEVAREGRISAAEVARRNGISASFLANIVHSLAKAGIALTTRGAGGGVSLARPAESLTVLEVIEAVQGPLSLHACVDRPEDCPRIMGCTVHPLLCLLQRRLREGLDVSFAELLDGHEQEIVTKIAESIDTGDDDPTSGNGQTTTLAAARGDVA